MAGTGSAAYFVIVIGDQPALDFGATRNPDKQGFAAFGRVVSGMDFVRKIHSVPADRFVQEEGYTGGQILKEPVRIINAEISEKLSDDAADIHPHSQEMTEDINAVGGQPLTFGHLSPSLTGGNVYVTIYDCRNRGIPGRKQPFAIRCLV
jgi:hypothetical protein